MPETVVDFWKMIWDNDVKIVIMACNEYEGIPRKVHRRLLISLSVIMVGGVAQLVALLCWARLVLQWVTACGQVNHLDAKPAS